MAAVYIREQGVMVTKQGERLVVSKGANRLIERPVIGIDALALFGNVQISSQAIALLLERGIDISFFTYGGKYLGHVAADTSKNIFLRMSQYDLYMENEKRMALARVIVEAKIKNQLAVMKSHRWEEDFDWKADAAEIEKNLGKLPEKRDGNGIRGIEGICSNIYFHSYARMFNCDFKFEKRSRRPPGIRVRFEFSGFRGYHVWLFLDSWVPTYHVNNLSEIIEREFADAFGNDISIEFFPNKARMKPDKPGQCVKLPCGIRSEAGSRSVLLLDDFSEAEDLEKWLDDTAKYPLAVIKRIVAAERKGPEEETRREVDTDLSCFGELAPNIDAILKKCGLMRYLCRKAHDSGYLTHFERLSILYVFGHVGEEGKRFIHQVMGYTLNYKQNVTERFIRKCPEKPISCVKLREQYKRISWRKTSSMWYNRLAGDFEAGASNDGKIRGID